MILRNPITKTNKNFQTIFMSLFGQITVGQIATGLHLKKFNQPGPKKFLKIILDSR